MTTKNNQRPKYTSKLAQARIARIMDIASREPVCSAQIADAVNLCVSTAWDYVTHMRNAGALKLVRTDGKVSYYRSTGIYHPSVIERTVDTPVREAPHVKPFRCEWTTAFFGPATSSQ